MVPRLASGQSTLGRPFAACACWSKRGAHIHMYTYTCVYIGYICIYGSIITYACMYRHALARLLLQQQIGTRTPVYTVIGYIITYFLTGSCTLRASHVGVTCLALPVWPGGQHMQCSVRLCMSSSGLFHGSFESLRPPFQTSEPNIQHTRNGTNNRASDGPKQGSVPYPEGSWRVDAPVPLAVGLPQLT